MSRLRRSLAFGFVIAAMAGLVPSLAAQSREVPREGLVVIDAPSTSSLEQAGLERGDILLSWQRGNASGLLRWPHGLAEAETEQAPWGVVRLTGWRAGQPMTWQMPPVRWNVRTRPALSPYLLTLYEEGARKAAAREPEAAAESWLAAVDATTRADDQPRAAWFLSELGRAQAAASQWEKADLTYESAIGRVEGGGMAAYLKNAGTAPWTAADLYRRLFQPADEQIARAERLVLLPDEVLASLPFGSLLRGDSPLAQQKPLETATSVTAWAALQKVLRGGNASQDRAPAPGQTQRPQ